MSVGEVQIYERVAYLCEQMNKQLGIKNFEWLDYDDIIITNSFSTKGILKLEDETSIMVFEKYVFAQNKLRISRYCYSFYNSDGQDIFRAENSEHHDVSTTPHHIQDRRFGGEKVKPFRRQELDNPDITEFFAHIHGERR